MSIDETDSNFFKYNELDELNNTINKLEYNVTVYMRKKENLLALKTYLLDSGDSNIHIPKRLFSLEHELSEVNLFLMREESILCAFKRGRDELLS